MMQINFLKYCALACLVIALLTGCNDYLGEKTDISFIDLPEFQERDVAYVPILPVIDGFVDPTCVIAGFDDLIYVVDAGTQEVIAFDEAGRELSRLFVPGVTKIAQDRRLDILAIGRANVNGVAAPLAAVYRIRLISGGSYGLNNARFMDTVIHPYTFGYPFRTESPEISFNGIAVMADNSYYLTRQGPNQTINRIEGPDDAVILMTDEDAFQTTVNVNSAGVFFRDFFKRPGDIATFAQPPQIAVNASKSFVYISEDPSAVFKVRQIDYIETENGASFEPAPIPSAVPAQTVSNAFMPNRFVNPVGLGIAGSGSSNRFLFVLDQTTDSLYQFNGNGDEGVQPPASSADRNLIPVGFGGFSDSGNDTPTQLRNPIDAAFLNDIVYVLDNGNRRLLRYRLTSDFD